MSNRQSCDSCGDDYEKLRPYTTDFLDYNDDQKDKIEAACVCKGSAFEAGGRCLPKCRYDLEVKRLIGYDSSSSKQAYLCTKMCPSNTLQYKKYIEEKVIKAVDFDSTDYKNRISSQFTDVVSIANDCPPITRVAQFNKNTEPFQFIVENKDPAAPEQLTLSFWIFIQPMSYIAYPIRALGLILVTYSSGTLEFRVERASTPANQIKITSTGLVDNKWYHFSFRYSYKPSTKYFTLDLQRLETDLATGATTITDYTQVVKNSSEEIGLLQTEFVGRVNSEHREQEAGR